MSYNLLNYPGSTSSERNPHFRTVIASTNPDILVVQEITSQAGINGFLNNVLNVASSGFAAGTFIDGPDTDNGIFYKPASFTFLANNVIATDLRNINEFVLTENTTGDTLRIYSVHLKASTGTTNQQQRLDEVEALRNVTDNLPVNSNFLVCGDFNIYGSTEPAYQKLKEQQTSGYFVDILDLPGTWNNSSYASYHTQSTRVRQFGGGATGGMDDRFDMILFSQAVINQGHISYVPGSMINYGNDGLHYNDSINRPPNAVVSQQMADALHYSSDHLPVFVMLEFEHLNTFQLSVNIIDGWNMVSVPGLNSNGMGVNDWWMYRDIMANVFEFLGGYIITTSVTPGSGYWLKNSGYRTYNTGDEWPAGGIQIVAHDPITAASGWNLFGGYETSVATSGLSTNPPGLITGSVYKYSGGYQVATTLEPGYGYWVKLNGAGQIIIPEALAKGDANEFLNEDWGKIVFTDATGINYTLYAVKGEVDLDQYELPPAPPEGMFDIRFESGRIAEDINSSVKTIDMSGVTYPLTVKAENMDIRIMDETGKLINLNLKKGEDVVISDATIQKLMVSGELIPDKYALEQNYPNPFNPSTVIEFSLPENVGNVKLTIYNVLGEKVAELVNTSLIAGKYSYRWNANNVATGMYIYELRTDNFVFVKKMMLIK
jgi:hypothetical protein